MLDSVGEEGRLYSEHSMRRGGATQAASQGISDGMILQSGNWYNLQTASNYVAPTVQAAERFQSQLAHVA